MTQQFSENLFETFWLNQMYCTCFFFLLLKILRIRINHQSYDWTPLSDEQSTTMGLLFRAWLRQVNGAPLWASCLEKG